ncbi:MAG: protein phosphatase 2C domain-containing protein [Sphingomonas phyllosphaerae]
MHFDLIQSLSLCGDVATPNDDRAGCGVDRAWVIDGATDLSPPGLLGAQGGAAWLAATADAAFATAATETLRETCAHVFATVEARYAAQRRRAPEGAWEWPRAAFAAVQLIGDMLEVAWAADCAVLHASGEAVAWCTPAPDRSPESARAAALGPGIGATKLRTPAVLADRRAARAQPGQRAMSIDAAESARAMELTRVAVTPGDDLLLMSDGMAALIDSYAVYDAAGLVAALRSRGLAALGEELRAIEHEDAACTRYPRFKASDDATALWVRVGE